MKKYYIGLDIGTSSVGWVVTDLNYVILKKFGKRLMGSRLFLEGETAQSRRTFRNSRKRLMRRKYRLALLEELFSDEINKIDPEFFLRMRESKYHIYDKLVDYKYNLFNDDEYKDFNYHEEYPTIYHLRKHLMESDKKEDIRLIFLALHSITKRRGHFTLAGDINSKESNVENLIPYLIALLNREIEGYSFDEFEDKIGLISDVLLDKKKTLNDKKKELKKIISIDPFVSLFSLCAGSDVKLSDVFMEPKYKDESLLKISFKKIIYDEKRSEIESIIGEKIEIVDEAKKVYDAILLSNILGECGTISEAKVISYEKHRKDLAILKKVLRTDRKAYDDMFREVEGGGKKANSNANYTRYSRNSSESIGCGKEDFYKYVKNSLKNVKESKEKEYIINEIESGNFLPLQRNTDNAVIPYQIYKIELKKILEKAAKHYDFLNRKDGQYTVSEKIMMLLEFRIPYYVGPLNDYHSNRKNGGGNAWVVRKSNDRVTPWNFKDVIDIASSAENFITKMTNTCSYIYGEPTLPKNSLLYSEFALRNEINNISYNGARLSIDARERLFEYFKCEHDRMTSNRIKSFLKVNGFIDGIGEITGINEDIKSDLKSYRDMIYIFGEGFDQSMAEDIIRWITLFPDAPEILKQKVYEKYPDVTTEQMHKILNIRYKDWGSLSKRLLCSIKSEKIIDECGEPTNIINAMRATGLNLMQLLSDSKGYMEKIVHINKENFKDIEEVSYDILEGLYVSPSVKKALWQAVKITEEIKRIMGYEPDKIFIETTRGKSVDNRVPIDRKRKILNALKECKNEYKDLISSADATDAQKFRSKKLYLYYTQLGRCMYSGDKIELEDLFSNSYNIDHIYPRAKTKDDSWDNLVLVRAELNNDKRDIYPNPSIIDMKKKMMDHWTKLRRLDMISQEKFFRLTRETELTEDELRGFIKRQLVETAQSTKICAEVLGNINRNSRIVYVKAKNVAEFNQALNLYTKVRDLNDMHHAKDAYLNVVYGNVMDECFTKKYFMANKSKENSKFDRKYSLKPEILFSRDVYGRNKEGQYLVWKKDVHLEIVKKNVRSNNVQISNKAETQMGGLYDQTVFKARDVKKIGYAPLKASDDRLSNIERYGGFSKIKMAYHYVVKYTEDSKKGSDIKYSIVPIPVYIITSNTNIIKYIEDYIFDNSKGHVSNIEIVYEKLKLGQVVAVDGFRYYLGGKTNDYLNIDTAEQVIIDSEKEKTLKKICKVIKNLSSYENGEVPELTDDELIGFYECMLDKLSTNIFKNYRKNIYDKLSGEKIIEKFRRLSKMKKIEDLYAIFGGITGNMIDIKHLGIKQNRAVLSTKLSGTESFSIIEKSTTGVFEREVKIF